MVATYHSYAARHYFPASLDVMEFTADGNHALNAVISAVIAGTSLALQALFAEWIRLGNILVVVFLFWSPTRSMTRSLLAKFLPREQSYMFSSSYLGHGLSVLFFLLWFRGHLGKHALSYLLGYQHIAELIDWWLQCLRSDDPSLYAVDSGCFVVVKFLASSYWISMLAILYMGSIARMALSLSLYGACIAACIAMAWLIASKTQRADKFVKLALATAWLFFTSLDVYEVIDARIRVGLPEYISAKLAQVESRRKVIRQLPEYIHDSVSHTDREIRLLTIRKGSFLSGMVKASIMTTTLANAPPYEAISYCWGSSHRTREILINGERFAVTESAHSVLQARRSAWHDRIVWIDSICINQRDNQEKNHQVSMMQDIYQSATRVLVWLGGGWQQRLAASAITEIFANSVALQGSEIGTEMHYHFDRKRSYRPVWDALTELSENPYFSRIWIAQEVALNKNVHVFCGRRYHEWEHVVRTILYCFSPRRESLLSKNDDVVEATRGVSMHNLTMLSILREPGRGLALGNPDGLVLADALYYCSKFKATDARDRVFGLGGMVPTSPITPRYDLSEDQVFLETARQILPGSMHMLAFAGIGYPRKLDQLPSWVPDWSLNQPNHALWHTLHQYHTSGTTTSDVTFDLTAGSLTARGIILDAVVALSSSGPFHISEEEK